MKDMVGTSMSRENEYVSFLKVTLQIQGVVSFLSPNLFQGFLHCIGADFEGAQGAVGEKRARRSATQVKVRCVSGTASAHSQAVSKRRKL